ncbi:MAG: FkbM family methyltransferase [Pseudodesulfovibrio sp.]
MRIQDLLKEVEETLLERTSKSGYKSKTEALWQWASNTRGSMWKRFAFHLNRKTYKEWDNAEGNFGLGQTHQFWPLINDPAPYEAAYDKLVDDESRAVFMWRLKVRLSMPFVMGWDDAYPAPKPPGVGDLTIGAEEENFCKGFKDGQYLLRDICMPEAGDVVLDLGAFLGDSAVAFSRLVGDSGHVYSFEALSSQFETLKTNLAHFNCGNVTPCFNAAWNKAEELYMSSNRGSSSIGSGDHPVPGIRVDDFVRERGIEQVDFIKMDIEGAEQEAIEGCGETIKTFKPKLALSAYHKPEDLYLLMEMVSDLHPGYRFYMRHYDPAGFNDTVLYAVG